MDEGSFYVLIAMLVFTLALAGGAMTAMHKAGSAEADRLASIIESKDQQIERLLEIVGSDRPAEEGEGR